MEASKKQPFKASAMRARARRIAKARRQRMRRDVSALAKRIARRIAITVWWITLISGGLIFEIYITSRVHVESRLTRLCEAAGPALGLKTDYVSVDKIDLREGTGTCYYSNGVLEARLDDVTIGWKSKGGKWRWEEGYRTSGGEWYIQSSGDEKSESGFAAKPAPPLPRDATPADRLQDAEEYTVGEREARTMAELADVMRAPVPLAASLLQWL